MAAGFATILAIARGVTCSDDSCCMSLTIGVARLVSRKISAFTNTALRTVELIKNLSQKGAFSNNRSNLEVRNASQSVVATHTPASVFDEKHIKYAAGKSM